MGRYKMSISDYDGEVSSVTYPASDLTVGNIDTEATQAAALRDATMAISRGKLLVTETVKSTSPQGVGRATNAEAQREEKALVKYYDSVTFKRATLEIPCADMTKQNPDYPGVFFDAGSANNHADWTAYVTAFQAYVTAPDGNAPVVEQVIHVGRNL